MKQRINPGGTLDILTQDELVKLIRRPEEITHMRINSNIVLDATGSGDDEIYKVPIGYEFEVRRIAFTLTGNIPSDPNTGNVLLTVAGKFIAYMRGGDVIEYGQPQYGAAVQVPGVQTWSAEQGPHLANGEVFGVQAKGLTASLSLSVYLEGLLKRPSSRSND